MYNGYIKHTNDHYYREKTPKFSIKTFKKIYHNNKWDTPNIPDLKT